MKRNHKLFIASVSAIAIAAGVYSCSTSPQTGTAPKPSRAVTSGNQASNSQSVAAQQQPGVADTPPLTPAWPRAGSLSPEQKAGLELAKERRKARQFVEFLNRSWNEVRSQATQPSEPQTPEDFLEDNAVEVAVIRAHAGMEVYYASPNPNAESAPPPPPALAAAGPFRLRTLK